MFLTEVHWRDYNINLTSDSRDNDMWIGDLSTLMSMTPQYQKWMNFVPESCQSNWRFKPSCFFCSHTQPSTTSLALGTCNKITVCLVISLDIFMNCCDSLPLDCPFQKFGVNIIFFFLFWETLIFKICSFVAAFGKSVNFAKIFCCGAREHETRESRPPEAHNDEHSFNRK